MIIRFARHGQPALDGMEAGSNFEFPQGDYVLTPLGVKQAEFLGEYLKSTGFKGKVIASPYARTAQTASVAAAVCNLNISFEPKLQEMRFYPEPPSPGLTLDELKQAFPNVDPDAVLPWPWMTPGGEEVIDTVRRRVDGFVADLIADPPADDILLVGHGASIQSLKWNFYERTGFTGKDNYNWNCALSTVEVDSKGQCNIIEINRFDFIPLEFVTSNRRVYGDPECV